MCSNFKYYDNSMFCLYPPFVIVDHILYNTWQVHLNKNILKYLAYFPYHVGRTKNDK